MPLWLLFILVSFLLGLSLSLLLHYPFQRLERALFAFVAGHAVSLWLTVLISVYLASFSITSILLCTGLCASFALLLLYVQRRAGKWTVGGLRDAMIAPLHDDKYTLPFFAALLVYVVCMNLYGVLRPDAAGGLHAFLTVWADYPWHTSLITSLVYGDTFTFPLRNPQFLGVATHYPFLMDFYSAVLMEAGLSLRSAIIVPNILFQLALFGMLYYLTVRLTGSKAAGVGATIIFILAGFPAGLQEIDIHFLNPMYAVIMPQRTALFGLAISFIVYLLLFHALFEEPPDRRSALRGRLNDLVLAGALIGLLPYIHAHSFIAAGFVALSLAAYAGLKDRDWRLPVCLLLPLVALALPQLVSIRTGVSEEFFVFFPGWADTNRDLIMGFEWASPATAILSTVKSALLVEGFWALNAGGLFVLLTLGLVNAKRETRLFYTPFLLLFGVANVVKFQPWYFDNYKILLHWLALSSCLAPLALCWIREFKGRERTYVTVALAALLIATTGFGIFTHASMIEHTYEMWSGEEIAMAEWVRANTTPDSVFLTGTAHNHPIPSLTGRPRVMGYEGWLWSHGIPWASISERKKDMIAMFNGDDSLLRTYQVDYVCIGPYERAFAEENRFTINEAAFEDKTRFQLVYETILRGARWQIYEVTASVKKPRALS
jgi:hypothetical protein